MIVILLLTYRSPVLWLLPLIDRVRRPDRRPQAVIYLLARDAGLTVNAQSAFILTVLVFGAGTDYALLLIARYREELRRHDDRHEAMAVALRRAAPGDHRQRGHGDPEPADPAGGRAQLHQEPRPGDGDRRRGRPVGHDHPAAGAAGHLRPLGLLAAAAHAGSAEPTERGMWARIGAAHGPPAPAGLDRDRRRAGGRWRWARPAWRPTACRARTRSAPTPEAVAGEAALARHFAAGAGNPVQVIGSAEAAEAAAGGRVAATPGVDRPSRRRWSRTAYAYSRAR